MRSALSRPDVTILAFDTSAAHCAAALLKGGRIVASRHEEMAKGQAERLFPMLEEVLWDVGAVWQELDAIAVGTGPGNFTGIRIAVSAARGLALSLNIPAIGVSGFEALHHLAGRPDGRVAVFLEAPRKSAYFQILADGTPEGPPFLETFEQRRPVWSRQLDAVVGPGKDMLCTSVAYDFGPTGMHGAPADLPIQEMNRVATAIAEIAATRIDASPDRPAPLYIRPADAAPASDPPPLILP